MKCRRLDRHRADRVVWAVVVAHFADWQELDEFESDLSRPINELAQDRDVADPEIAFAA